MLCCFSRMLEASNYDTERWNVQMCCAHSNKQVYDRQAFKDTLWSIVHYLYLILTGFVFKIPLRDSFLICVFKE